MSTIELVMGNDYPLDGSITGFEAYMFITTPKFISEHSNVTDGVVIDGAKGVVSEKGWDNLDTRKKMLTLFNNKLKTRITNFPKGAMVSCLLIDLDITEDTTDEEINEHIEIITNAFIEWCTENDRAGACVPHLYQGNRLPHLHFLYNRGRGKHDEFQKYLYANYVAE